MTEVHLLSSYDEYIYFIERAACSSPTGNSGRAIVVLNNQALGRFIQSPDYPKPQGDRIFNVPPYNRSSVWFGRINLIAERRYYRQALTNFLRQEEFQGNLDLYVYANFMNPPTALLINHLRSTESIELNVKFLPSLPHVVTRPALRPTLKQRIGLIRSRLAYGPLLRLVDIGHKTILSISGQAFDEIIFEERSAYTHDESLIKLNYLTDNSPKVVFACQPLLKNSRVTSQAFREFFKTLCRTLSEINVGIVLKLHPGEQKIDYEYLGVPIISDEIPFQFLDISRVSAVLTFASGAAVIQKPVISCSSLLEFRSPSDKKEIDRLFDDRREKAGMEIASRPTNWNTLINEIKKATGIRASH